MTVAETVNSLDYKHRTYLHNRRQVYLKTTKKDDVKGEIRGYLRGLVNCGVIFEPDFRKLLTFYTI